MVVLLPGAILGGIAGLIAWLAMRVMNRHGYSLIGSGKYRYWLSLPVLMFVGIATLVASLVIQRLLGSMISGSIFVLLFSAGVYVVHVAMDRLAARRRSRSRR